MLPGKNYAQTAARNAVSSVYDHEDAAVENADIQDK